MNEELQKALGALLNKANNGIDTAGEFLASELPEVIQQLLTWHCAKAVVWGFTMFLTCIIATKLFVWAKNNEDFDEPQIIICIVSAPAGVVCFFVGLDQVLTALQIWIAPKVWLIEYAAKLAG